MVLITALLFFNSLWACIPGSLFLRFYYRWKRQELIAGRKKELSIQFREGIRSLSAALQAGFSVENALREAAKDLRMMEWDRPYMVFELEEMQHKIAASQTIEEAFRDFAGRSGIEDAYVFADIFSAAKRSGQDLTKVIGNTARIIGEKLEMEREIATILASRKYEQNIMSLMPLGMLLYLRLTSGGFLDVLYESLSGRALMAGCLIVYIAVWRLGKKLVQIEI
ncbi:MAG: type II secretion system F family protein [Lachnospiraceae bacterium]|nr:type II secretion system F family protein [Lachnospiraceae bacterium]